MRQAAGSASTRWDQLVSAIHLMQHSIALTIAQGITVFRLRSGILQRHVQHCLALGNGFVYLPSTRQDDLWGMAEYVMYFLGGTKVVRETFPIL